MISKMKANLHGIFWDQGKFDFRIPFIADAKKATMIFKKNLASITWNCMSTLEQNPTTLPQTQTILKGQSVGGVSIDDLLQVKHYGEGAMELVRLLNSNEFELDEKTACLIHKYVAKEDALEWGVFRYLDVGIHDVEYQPPVPQELKAIAEQGFRFLGESIENPCERAVALFLFMSRNQFFFDANKRTASLMMNGCLMKNGYWPITILNRDSEEFHEKLGIFYETGDANEMMKFFEKSIRSMYTEQQRS